MGAVPSKMQLAELHHEDAGRHDPNEDHHRIAPFISGVRIKYQTVEQKEQSDHGKGLGPLVPTDHIQFKSGHSPDGPEAMQSEVGGRLNLFPLLPQAGVQAKEATRPAINGIIGEPYDRAWDQDQDRHSQDGIEEAVGNEKQIQPSVIIQNEEPQQEASKSRNEPWIARERSFQVESEQVVESDDAQEQ